MARIRTIKPEFWDSPGVETLEPVWRLLYIAMWNWADDSGRGKAEARELMGFVFPRDEDMTLGEFRRGLGEVRRVFAVTFYRVGGRSYFSIPSWSKHQKIDKRSASRWPSPDEGEEYDPATNSAVDLQVSDPPRVPSEPPPSVRRDAGAGTGEQGNRGTEEQGKRATASPSRAARPPTPPPQPDAETEGQRINRLTKTYTDRVKLSSFKAVQGVVRTAVRCGDYSETQITNGLDRLASEPDRPVTGNTLRIAIERDKPTNRAPLPAPSKSFEGWKPHDEYQRS